MMTQSGQQGNEFTAEPVFRAEGLPPFVGGALAGRQVILNASEIDYREMSKEFEQANTAGIALYPIQRPGVGGPGPSSFDALGRPAQECLRRVMKGHTWVMTQFGAGPVVRLIVPQDWGYLAQGIARLSGAAGAVTLPEPADFTLLVWPEPLARRGGRVVLERGIFSGAGEMLMIGSDDPRSVHMAICERVGDNFFADSIRPAASLMPDEAARTGAIWFEVPLDERSRPIGFKSHEISSPAESSGLVILPESSI